MTAEQFSNPSVDRSQVVKVKIVVTTVADRVLLDVPAQAIKYDEESGVQDEEQDPEDAFHF